MLKFDDAFEAMIGSARLLGTECVDIGRALNRILAQDVASDIEMPPFNKSAMDGFACRRADMANELTVIETIPAGRMPGSPHRPAIRRGAEDRLLRAAASTLQPIPLPCRSTRASW